LSSLVVNGSGRVGSSFGSSVSQRPFSFVADISDRVVDLYKSWTAPTLASVLKEDIKRVTTGAHPLVLKPEFVSAIKETCLAPAMYGVFVVWAPAGSGKTNYILHAADEWLKSDDGGWGGGGGGRRRRRHVRYVRAYRNNSSSGGGSSSKSNSSSSESSSWPDELLKKHLRVADAEELGRRLDALHSEVVLVLDQFDDAFSKPTSENSSSSSSGGGNSTAADEQLGRFVRELAAVSTGSRNFRVVLALRNPGLAATVLGWRSGIHLCGGADATRIRRFKWGEDEARGFLLGGGGGSSSSSSKGGGATATAAAGAWSDEDQQLFVEAVCESGCIETMVELKRDRTLLRSEQFRKIVEADGKKWEEGIEILQSRPL
jgi:hypothetical protein